MQKYGMKHQWIDGLNFGLLRPVFLQEVSPGEIWKGFSRAIFRMAPLNFPLYMQAKVHVHFFYCPYRLIWDEFPEVWTGEDTTTPWPTVTYSAINTWWNVFGVPPITLQTPTMNLLPIRVFNKIWNDHFRNPEEQAENSLDLVSGPLPRVHHSSNEYFGSIQTELQKGVAEQIPITAGAPDYFEMSDFREAANRQRYKERRSLYGERYEDVLRTESGIDISEVRLQKPEHCARGRATIGISEVTVTATSASENSGEYKGHGISGMNLRFPARKFPEPGMLMGVAYLRPRLQLRTSLDKVWLTQSNEDLYHPHLETDTQQIVSSGEIYAESASYSNFGYVGKFDHLRKARDVLGQASEMADFQAYKELTTTPSVALLHQVDDYDQMFQDTSSTRQDVRFFFDHHIGKLSPIKRRQK